VVQLVEIMYGFIAIILKMIKLGEK
jgi:hypothetical protein